MVRGHATYPYATVLSTAVPVPGARGAPDLPGGTVAGVRRFGAMGLFRDPLVLLLVAAAAAIAFFIVATTPL